MKKTYFKFFTPLIKRSKKKKPLQGPAGYSPEAKPWAAISAQEVSWSTAVLTRLQVGCLLLPLSRGHLRSGTETEWPEETEVLPVWTVAEVCRFWVLPRSGQGDKRHGQAEGSTLSSRDSR